MCITTQPDKLICILEIWKYFCYLILTKYFNKVVKDWERLNFAKLLCDFGSLINNLDVGRRHYLTKNKKCQICRNIAENKKENSKQ